MKKWLSIVLVLLLLGSLAACGKDTPEKSEPNLDWVWVRDYPTRGALSDTGYYYVEGSILHYFDFAANAGTVLCSKSDCRHKSESCDASIHVTPLRPMLFSEGRLYYFDMQDSVLYSRNAIGIDLKQIGTLGAQYIKEQKSVKIDNCAAAGGYLYYEADVYAKVTDENGVSTTKLERECIGRINLSTGKDEILVEEIHDKQSEKLILCAARANGILLSRWEGMEEMDRHDPAYIEATGKIPVTLEHWNGETGETTVLFRKTTNECAGIKMVSGGKVYYKTLSGANAADAGHTYSYELNTGKTETACAMPTRWHLGGVYVQCTDPEAQETVIYDMGSGRKLPYELEGSGTVYNISDNGYVMQMTESNGDGSGKAYHYYYITLDSLADGLQEADLNLMFSTALGTITD